MKCPLCNTETRINKSVNVIKDAKLYRKMTYVCRNLGCSKYGEEVGTEYHELDVTFEEDSE